MPILRCLDCGFSAPDEDFDSLTEEEIVEHFDSAGLPIPDHAFDRVGSLSCPECSSDQLE